MRTHYFENYEISEFDEISIISQNFCSRLVRYKFELHKIEADSDEEALIPKRRETNGQKPSIGSSPTSGSLSVKESDKVNLTLSFTSNSC